MMCVMATATGVMLQRLAVAACCLLSAATASYLVYICAVRLRRHLGELLVQQLLALATTDVLHVLWFYVVPCVSYRRLLWNGSATWCQGYISVLRVLQLLSGLFSAATALGLLAVVLRAQTMLKVLPYTPVLVVPLAVVLNLRYFHAKGDYSSAYENGLGDCLTDSRTQRIFALEVVAIFVIVIGAGAVIACRACHTAPGSVVRRTARSASRYIVAFFLSYAVFVLSQLLDPDSVNYAGCTFGMIHGSRDLLYLLNGFFNYLAFQGHVLQVHSTHAHEHDASGPTLVRPSVGFRAIAEVQEFRTNAAEVEFGDFLVVVGTQHPQDDRLEMGRPRNYST
eukprot:NODE_1216_length_1207_cov_354.165799.p1 GENE.NODE_1216_length_1207_cov_354.165799~~NODE_1216_length_1207_cov_354.165799.p1  ORF type:complete len:354 (-),score=102.77 NODE_1216_length_1207_cov_354.165799:145-1158(-)